jgi:hypothetical protein
MIYLLINYARSGGTLFSKIIASQKNVVLLSEVNPNHNAVYSPAQQANLWYCLNIDEGLSYQDQVKEIYQKCMQQNKTLVIRDFTFIDFTPHQLNNFKPKKVFSNYEVIKQIAPVNAVAFVRNAIDVWISRDCPPKFSEGYLEYINFLMKEKIPIFKYEEFTKNPEGFLIEFGKTWAISDLSYSNKMLKYQKVTGDNQLKKPSRGSNQQTIKPLKRKQLAKQLISHLHNDVFLLEANNLIAYPTNYQENLEFKHHQFWLNLKHRIRKLKGSYPSAEY